MSRGMLRLALPALAFALFVTAGCAGDVFTTEAASYLAADIDGAPVSTENAVAAGVARTLGREEAGLDSVVAAGVERTGAAVGSVPDAILVAAAGGGDELEALRDRVVDDFLGGDARLRAALVNGTRVDIYTDLRENTTVELALAAPTKGVVVFAYSLGGDGDLVREAIEAMLHAGRA